MNGPRIGSLCSGYGGLEMAIQSVYGGETIWHADPDPGASKILAHHWPTVPNLGDITTVDWRQVLADHGPVDIAGMGFPCTDLSLAGLQAGIAPGTRSGIWTHCAQAISVLNPKLVVIENVRGLLSAPAHSDLELCPGCVGDRPDGPVLRALGAVLGDLADLGFDAEWIGLPASDPRIRSCHERWREFILAWPAASDPDFLGWDRRPRNLTETHGGNEPANSGVEASGSARELSLIPTPTVADSRGTRNAAAGRREGAKFNSGKTLTDFVSLLSDERWVSVDGVDYGPAIRRWEATLGRPAPVPTDAGKTGNRRIMPEFSEWMQGLPAGHVTAVPDLPRKDQLRAIGNGVCPQHAALGIRLAHDRAAASLTRPAVVPAAA